jgi:hypothetical protein
MTGGTLAWGIAFAVLCVITGILIGLPIGHSRGLKHAAEDAADALHAAVVAGWKDLPDEDTRPSPPWPPAPPETPHAGPGKHRHPAGPRHAELPVAGYLPAEPEPWNGTITLPAPVQQPPWDISPAEPQTQVLEPTAVLPPPDPRTDTAWTRDMAADMDRWIAEHITATDSTLKEITGGAR